MNKAIVAVVVGEGTQLSFASGTVIQQSCRYVLSTCCCRRYRQFVPADGTLVPVCFSWTASYSSYGQLRLLYRSKTLPLADVLERLTFVPTQSETLPRKNSVPMAAWRVLVVDDSKALRDAVNRLLAGLPDWQICGEATNGREAIAKAMELEPDVILMDVGMPELDGLEATRRIRQQLDVEVLIFTQYDNRQAGQEAMAAGARGFLPKSRAANLVEALEAVVQHQNYPAHSLENSVASGSSC